jgi:hypothetical protein
VCVCGVCVCGVYVCVTDCDQAQQLPSTAKLSMSD